MAIQKTEVVAIGEILIDFASIGQAENGYPLMQANPGGAPVNYLAALSKYGFKTSMIGKVGNDVFGNLLENTLLSKGIGTKGIIKSDEYYTTLAFVTFDSEGDRSFSFARKPGADASLSFSEVDTGLIASAGVLHFGTVSMTGMPASDATKKAVMWAKDNGKLISFDPNLREPLWDDMKQARDAMLWGLKMADVVKISDNEVGFLWDTGYKEGAEKIINEYGVKLVFVTLGPSGCYFLNRNGGGQVEALKVRPVDTTGAGDIFAGSAMSRLLKYGRSPDELTADELYEIVRFASAAASLSTEKQGGLDSIPDEEEVLCHLPG